MYNDKSISFDILSIKHIDKETYFRDIHLFFKYIRDIIDIKDNKLIRINL